MTSEHSALNGTEKPTDRPSDRATERPGDRPTDRTTDRTADAPMWEDVAKVLRARIDTGELEAGASMPTQAALVREFGVRRSVVRQALKLLQDQGLLTAVTRGSPARVAARSARPEAADGTPRQTMVALGPRITEALGATDVRIDALCLTAESLSAALGEQRLLIHSRASLPATITVRVLLPNRDIELAFPRMVGGPAETDPVHKRWLRQRNAHGTVLGDHLTGLGATHGIDVDVEFRALPFTPPVKLYVLNGTEALFAFYRVKVREEKINKRSVEMFDALGVESPLFPFAAGDERSQRDGAFAAQAQAWFEALWNTIATPLELD